MSGTHRKQLRNIVGRLQVILDELDDLELNAEEPIIKQVAFSASHALKWIGLTENCRPKPKTKS
jgi:hypothetical protein